MTDTQDLIAQLRLGASISRDRNLNLDFAKVADEAANKLDAAQAEIANLHTVMMAAAVEISEHWDAHCDAEGYGPVNLLRRLENGYPEKYGYDAHTVVRMEKERDAAQAEIERLATVVNLQVENYAELKEQYGALEGYFYTVTTDRDAALARLAELEKQEPVATAHDDGYWTPKKTEVGRAFNDRLNKAGSRVDVYAAAGASPEPSALQAENANLITALAVCRGAFPVPYADSRLYDWYVGAMADPLAVPDYVKACVGASPVQPERTPLEQHDLDQSPEYREGYEDGRLRGFEVGQRYAKEQAVQPSQTGEPTEAQLVAGVKAMRLFVTKNSVKDFRDGFIAAINAKESGK